MDKMYNHNMTYFVEGGFKQNKYSIHDGHLFHKSRVCVSQDTNIQH